MREGAKAPAGSPPRPSWLRRTGTGWTIAVHVQPGAKRSAVSGLHGERLKLRDLKGPGRIREIIIDVLDVAGPSEKDGKRAFKLTRRQ